MSLDNLTGPNAEAPRPNPVPIGWREGGAAEARRPGPLPVAWGEGQNRAEARPFVIARSFNAPRELVWKAWTERKRLMQWFGPKGFTMPAAKLDLRPGGVFHYCLVSPDGKEMWGKFVYREIVEPEWIVLVSSFSDEEGGITRHPFSTTWPLEMLSATTFREDAEGRTKITLEWSPLNPTEAERKTFDQSHEGMKQGWTGTFDQLAEYLAGIQGQNS